MRRKVEDNPLATNNNGQEPIQKPLPFTKRQAYCFKTQAVSLPTLNLKICVHS